MDTCFRFSLFRVFVLLVFRISRFGFRRRVVGGDQVVTETTMLRRTAAAEFAGHCFPKAVVLTVPCGIPLWTETTSFPWRDTARDLGERPWSTDSKSELPGTPFFQESGVRDQESGPVTPDP